MKSFWKTTLAASLVAITATVLISGKSEDSDPTTLSEFNNYRMTDIGGSHLEEYYKELSPDLAIDAGGNCYRRAELWSYQLYKQHAVQSGKVFVFYAYRTNPKKPSSYNFNRQGWWFHVAPYVVADGKEYVLEKFGSVTVPMPFNEWANKQTGGNQCQILSSEEKKDRKKIFTPLSDPRRAKSFENDIAPCFIRKAPMYYKSTASIGSQGLGKANYTRFSSNDVFDSCFNTIAGDDATKRAKCSAFIASGDPKAIAPTVIANQPLPTPATATPAPALTPESMQPTEAGSIDSLFDIDSNRFAP